MADITQQGATNKDVTSAKTKQELWAEYIAIQEEYNKDMMVEMREDCETYMKATECHEYAKMLVKSDKLRQGFEQYKKNCYEHSSGASCHNAGNMLLREEMRDKEGNLVMERDVPAGAEFYKQGCTMNGVYGRSCVTIARLLQLGQFLEKDYKKAFEYLTVGCRKNDNESCFAKANCYLQGMGVEQDYSKAAPLLEAGCIKGHHRSCHNLGVLYFHGHGVVKDMNKFKEFNDRAKIFRAQKDPFAGKHFKATEQQASMGELS